MKPGPGPEPDRHAVLLGTVKLVGADVIVPLVALKLTVVPAGMILPLTSVMVTTTVAEVPGAQFPKLTLPALNRNTGFDPENTIGKLRRTSIDLEAEHVPGELIPEGVPDSLHSVPLY